jgi:Zn-finger nucleic acid-binding protein
MKCPACKKTLREKVAGAITVDVCHGGCGGIWFDAKELERAKRVDAAATLHTVWQSPSHAGSTDGPRACPRCPDQVLERKWFSAARKIEIDACAKCGGIWLDDGEFTGIFEEARSGQPGSPAWAVAVADAVKMVKGGGSRA